jgi:HK97 gp10 family phage protein
MTKTGVTVTGFTELERALRALPRAVELRAARATLRDLADPLRAGMAQRAPRSRFSKWHLADSIVVKPIKEENTTVSIAVGPERYFFYGRFVEWGTSRSPAHPFMRPAWDEFKPYALEALGVALWRRIAEQARRLAKK